MLSVAKALAEVIRRSSPVDSESIPLGHALNRTLATDVASGIDSPPFDKALMDGFAVRSADTAEGTATLKIVETVTAGQVPTQSVSLGEATRIMTGAPMPQGADAVVPVEQT